MQTKKGFTIIEIVVVIAIITVLAAITMALVNGYVEKSQKSATLAELRQMTTTATIYYGDKGDFSDFDVADTVLNLENRVYNIKPGSYLLFVFSEKGNSYNGAGHGGLTPCSSQQWVAEVYAVSAYIYCADYMGYVGPGTIRNSRTDCFCSH